jgi:hypothetical protein
MAVARRILTGLAWLYVLGIVVQFFLAGLGLLGGESMTAHSDFGWSVLHLFPILLIIAAAVGRVGRNLLIMVVALAVVGFVQPLWVTEFRGELLGAMHVLGALVIFVLAHNVARASTRLGATA